MKRIIVILAVLIQIGGCFGEGTNTVTDKDTTAPEISIASEMIITITEGTPYSEKGVSATDNKDGNLTDKIAKTYESNGAKVESINTTLIGEYTIKYNVTDTAGNKAIEKQRTVKVEAMNLKGIWNFKVENTVKNSSTLKNIEILKENNVIFWKYSDIDSKSEVQKNGVDIVLNSESVSKLDYELTEKSVTIDYGIKTQFIGKITGANEIKGSVKETVFITVLDEESLNLSTAEKEELDEYKATINDSLTKEIEARKDSVFSLYKI